MHPRAGEFEARAETDHDLQVDVKEVPGGTSSAADAAAAIGCTVAEIASSLVFRTPDPVVVVTSGANRVSEGKLAAAIEVPEEEVEMASPEAIRETVGWSIGGVPPFCHDEPVPVYLDRDLTAFEVTDTDADGLATDYDPGYGWKAGTSMAALRVAGAVALIKSVDPDYNVNRVESVLKRTTEVPDGYDKAYYGTGFIDPLEAVRDRENAHRPVRHTLVG